MPDSTIFVLIAVAYLLWFCSMLVGAAAPDAGTRPATTTAPSSVVGGLGDAAGRSGSSGGRP